MLKINGINGHSAIEDITIATFFGADAEGDAGAPAHYDIQVVNEEQFALHFETVMKDFTDFVLNVRNAINCGI